ncbi:SRPBCC family protein [Sphingomonas sp. MS122]|uniref:SRPBCC family protein n=1 Tax=Sphingomonas sp. MS122 TaxID=3412683 RepID=UPI003C2C012B
MRGLIALLLILPAVPAAAQDVRIGVEIAADGTRTLSHEVIVPAPPEQVWRAVATLEGWREWAVPLARPVPGSDRFETGYDPDTALGAANTIEQQWIARERPRLVSFRTTRTPAGFPHAAAYLRVANTFTLEAEGSDATRVRLVGSGYTAGAEGDALIAFFREGNRSTLQQLHKRFVSGPIAWPKQPGATKGK